MSTVPAVAVSGLTLLVDELAGLSAGQTGFLQALRSTRDDAAVAAWRDATRAIDAADRGDFLQALTDRVAANCIRASVPQHVRYAAYDAILAIVARDLIPPTHFATLYEPLRQALGDHPTALELLTVEDAAALAVAS